MAYEKNEDYIEVAERIAEFREKHPDGCLRPADMAQPFTIQKVGEKIFVVVVAAAYRAADDPLPGIGMAWESFPGTTPYTRNSELMNAETSAWGRAIVAALKADTKRGIATAQEARNRAVQPDDRADADNARAELMALFKQRNRDPLDAVEKFRSLGHGDLKGSRNVAAIQQLITHFREVQ